MSLEQLLYGNCWNRRALLPHTQYMAEWANQQFFFSANTVIHKMFKHKYTQHYKKTAYSCNMGHSSRSTKPPAELHRGIYIFHTSNTHQLVQLCKQSSTFIKNIWREKNGLFWTSMQMQPSLFCSEREKTHMHTHKN